MAMIITIITFLLLSANIITADDVKISVEITFDQSTLEKENKSRTACNKTAVNIMGVVKKSLDIFKNDIVDIKEVATKQGEFNKLIREAADIIKNDNDCNAEIKNSIKLISDSFFDNPQDLFTFTTTSDSIELINGLIETLKSTLQLEIERVENNLVEEAVFALSKVKFTGLKIITHLKSHSDNKADKTFILPSTISNAQHINIGHFYSFINQSDERK